MAQFVYHAVHQVSGAAIKGKMRAKTVNGVIKKLLADGYVATSITPKRFALFLPKDENIKLSFLDKYAFTKQLATIINAGITLSDGIDILLRQAKSGGLNRVLTRVYESINSGESLSKSLEQFPRSFEPIYIKILELGESSGNLAKVLSYLEQQLKKDYNLRRKVKGALFYPLMIVSLVGIVGVGLITFIIPRIERIFGLFKIDLPLPTRALLFSNTFLRQYGIFVLVGIIALFILLRWLLTLPPVKKVYDYTMLKMPLFGAIIRQYNLAIFCRMLATLLKSGVPIAEGLKTISELLSNSVYREKLLEAHERVQAGSPLHAYLENEELFFPAFLFQMIHVGERTGTVETTMQHLADSYEEELDSDLKSLSTLIEPLLLLFAGLCVGGIALSIILPIYQLPNLINR